MSLYSSGKVVITDRLHMSIFAVLLHKPHIILDQMYGKIRYEVRLKMEKMFNLLDLLNFQSYKKCCIQKF